MAAVVGYTNAGKSTLLNLLTGADLVAEDRLFATLDPTTRSFVLPNKQRVLLTDTVGFLRKLPHTLIEHKGPTDDLEPWDALTLLARELRANRAVATIVPFGTTLHVSGHDAAALERALDGVRARPELELTQVEPSLEDVFISLMQGAPDNVQ